MPLSFETPVTMLLAGVLSLSAVTLWTFRGNPCRGSLVLLIFATICITIAAGSPRWIAREKPRVALMFDCSPSMRGMKYVQRTEWVQRLAELQIDLRDLDATFYTFANGKARKFDGTIVRSEAPVLETVFNPPEDVDAILLFSDGQFEANRNSPPVFAVLDPNLDNPQDAAITALTQSGDRLMATVRNEGTPRAIFAGSRSTTRSTTVPTGTTVIELPGGTASQIRAQLDRSDRWPENDTLTLVTADSGAPEHWWVSTSRPAPPGWTPMKPEELADSSGGMVTASVIALDNIDADALSYGQRSSLKQYVQLFGGSLVIVGGDHAFAAGGYGPTDLDLLSPLASNPPAAERNWILLADSSGSMAASAGQSSRWDVATAALSLSVNLLPENDRAHIGDFARSVRWWMPETTVLRTSQSAASSIPLITPQGPTNLQAALAEIADSDNPTEVILITDAQTQIDDVKSLAADLVRRKIHIHLLATAPIDDSNVVAQLVKLTGGIQVVENDPQQWVDAAGRLTRAASPARLKVAEEIVQFSPSTTLTPLTVAMGNIVWIREDASSLASFADGSAAAAGWYSGSGRVVAFAFTATQQEVTTLANSIEQSPRDPQFKVAWDIGADVRVTVDAFDAGKPMNNLPLDAEVLSEYLPFSMPVPLKQVGPGRYSAIVPSVPTSSIGSVRIRNHLIERRAIAGRYAKEFEHIGNDRVALNTLADRTGGRVIEPSDRTPIVLPRRTKTVSLTSQLSLLGATMLVLGLIVQRRGRVR